MAESSYTCWAMIQGAAAGDAAHRDAFADRYSSVIRSYLGARWARTPLLAELDDAMQEVFVDCFRTNGALARVDADQPGGFRAFLYGVVRNVARRAEERRRRPTRSPGDPEQLQGIASEEESLSRVFDRAWALAILRQAAEVQEERARSEGAGAIRRLDLLRLRFHKGLPIRDIASQWDEDPAHIHTEYARARDEFKAALREVVRGYDSVVAVDAECARILAHLS